MDISVKQVQLKSIKGKILSIPYTNFNYFYPEKSSWLKPDCLRRFIGQCLHFFSIRNSSGHIFIGVLFMSFTMQNPRILSILSIYGWVLKLKAEIGSFKKWLFHVSGWTFITIAFIVIEILKKNGFSRNKNYTNCPSLIVRLLVFCEDNADYLPVWRHLT